MFYSAAIPFNFARNPYFRSFCTSLANSKLDGYLPPPYNRLRTTLLAQEKAHLRKLLQPTRDSWVKKGLSLCSDGWSDGVNRPIINVMAASGTSAIFVDSVDASGKRKDAAFVAEVFIQAIKEVGPENVVQVITDNGANFKAAGSIVESKYPHIFWTPCVVHCVNLAFKSICEPTEKSAHYDQCIWLQQLCADVHDIQKFVNTHDMVKAIFKRHTKLQLLSVAETRFASHYVVAERMKVVKDALEQMVMDPDFRVLFRSPKNPIDIKARECKERILSDTWWDKLDYFLKFAGPIYEMIRIGDRDAPVLHLIYDMWDSMIEGVKVQIFEHEGKDIQSDSSPFFDVIQEVLVSRWNKSNTPIHCLAHSLVPKFYTTNWLKGNRAGFSRIAPNEDEEVSNNRNECLRRLFPDPDSFKHARLEYGAFSSEAYPFNQPHIIAARDDEEPIIWWANYGSSTPHLQSLAFKLLSQPASSSCCERNWSHYDNIQTVKRNRLTSERARDLVFCHNNLRQVARREESYKSGPTRYWDIGGDKFDVDADVCEIADLSINEPDLERALLGVGVGEEDED